MLDSINRAILSLASPETLKSVGLWLIIGGLIAEAAVIILVPSGKTEKALSVIFTLVIAAGVWVEHIGASTLEAAHAAEAKQREAAAAKRTAELNEKFAARRLKPEQRQIIVDKLRGSGLKIVLRWGADPEAHTFSRDLWDAFIEAQLEVRREFAEEAPSYAAGTTLVEPGPDAIYGKWSRPAWLLYKTLDEDCKIPVQLAISWQTLPRSIDDPSPRPGPAAKPPDGFVLLYVGTKRTPAP